MVVALARWIKVADSRISCRSHRGTDPRRPAHRPDGERLAEVVRRDDDGTWQWWRYTSIERDGVPAAKGREPSRREAMKRAATGIGERCN